MHTLEILNVALDLAEAWGYGVRHEWLGGTTGGLCTIANRPWLFVDLARNPLEQLDQVVSALAHDPRWHGPALPDVLRHYSALRRAA